VAIRYLLDTNVLSEPLKQNPQMTVLERIRTHSAEIATASVVWHELWYGMHRMAPSRKKDAIQEYLLRLEASSMSVLPYDEVAAAKHGAERSRLEQMGKTPAFADGQIAAIAQVHGLVLATRNVQDFSLFCDLPLENWWTCG
jgi:tRNA(fMet)-specific endonuclease VapC